MLRHLLAAAAALTAAAALAPAAHAYTRFTFATERGAPSRVLVDSPYAHTRLEIARDGVVVGNTAQDELDITGLIEGDIATVYFGQTAIASATYKPLPAINETACVGRSAFNVQRALGAIVLDAGAYQSDYPIDSIWTAGESLTVTLERPLQPGDVAYALTSELIGGVEIFSHRAVPVTVCPLPPAPTIDLVPIAPPPPVPPPSGGPTEEQSHAALKGSVAATGSSLRPLRLPRLAKRASVSLPFAFPEPGGVTLELVAKGKAIGTGTKSSTANGKVNVSIKLTADGRKLLKRTKKKLKVTVKGTFTPSRTGGSAQSTAVTVTLKR
jgi:hypothetical protein